MIYWDECVLCVYWALCGHLPGGQTDTIFATVQQFPEEEQASRHMMTHARPAWVLNMKSTEMSSRPTPRWSSGHTQE